MKTETRKLTELVPYAKNPRTISEEKAQELKRKISRWGQLGALLIDGRDNKTILGGNHVFEAMKALGLEKATVEYRTPKDDAEALELVILHNEKYAQWVQQDLGKLLKEYKDRIDLSEYHIDLGKGTELKTVLARFGATEDDDFDATLPAEPVSKFGEVYQLGSHRLMCGDATDPQSVKKLMNQEQANLVVTDPPYGVSYKGNPNGQEYEMIKNDELRGGALIELLQKSFTNIALHGVKNMPAYVFYASSTHKEFQDALEAAGFKVRQQLIWAKHMVIGNSDYHWAHEPILYLGHGKERPIFHGDRTNKTVLDTVGDIAKLPKEKLLEILSDLQSTVIRVRKDSMKYQHPTQKPVGILTPLIKNSSAVEEVVVDLFAGSGSTIIACQQLGRYAYAMEFSPAFCDVIRRRYAKFVGKENKWEEETPVI